MGPAIEKEPWRQRPERLRDNEPGRIDGRIPANVSLAARAIVTAGLANDVDAVNQYAAVM